MEAEATGDRKLVSKYVKSTNIGKIFAFSYFPAKL